MRSLLLAASLALVCAFATVKATDPQTATLRAGDTYFSGTAVGTGTAARFAMANGIAQLNANPDYVVSMPVNGGSNELRKVDSSWVVTSQATTGTAFTYPTAVMVAGGKVHLIGNTNMVLEVDGTTWVASVLAGDAASGHVNSPGTAARFNSPQGMAHYNSDASILVADTGNDCIRSIVISTGVVADDVGVCGTPGVLDAADGTNARFNQPRYIAAWGTSFYYVFDNTGIRRVQPSNSSAVETILLREENRFYVPRPLPMFFDTTAEALYIQSSSGLWKITDTDNQTALATSWISMSLPLISPSGVLPTITANTVTAIGSNAVVQIDLSTTQALPVPVPQLYVNSTTDYYAANVVAGSGYKGAAANVMGNVARFRGLTALAQLPNGELIAADTDNGVLRQLAPGAGGWADSTDTTVTTLTVSSGPTISSPRHVFVKAANEIYLTMTNKIIQHDGTTTTVLTAGADDSGYVLSAVAATERYSNPNGIFFVKDGTEQLAVCDTDNYVIRRAGVAAVIAGANAPGHVDGVGANARFQRPYHAVNVDLSVDVTWTVYVSDNDIIRRLVNAAGPATTVTTVTSLTNFNRFSGAFYISLTWDSTDSVLYLCDGSAVSRMFNFTTDGSEAEYPVLEYLNFNEHVPSRTSRGQVVKSTTDLIFTAGSEIIRIDLSTSGASSWTPPPTVTPMNGSDVYLTYTNRAGTDFSGSTDGLPTVPGKLVSASAIVSDGQGTPALYYIFDSASATGGGTVVRTLDVSNNNLQSPGHTVSMSVTDAFVDSTTTIYLLSHVSSQIQTYTIAGGAFALVAGSGSAGHADGSGNAASFHHPEAFVKRGAAATILVSDTGNACIRDVVMAANGAVTSIIGSCREEGETDGTGTAARFKAPKGIAYVSGASFAAASFYVIDNKLLRKIIESSLAVTTVGRFGYDQEVNGQGVMPHYGAMRFGADSLWLSGGNANLLQITNITDAAAGYVYTYFHPIGMAPGLTEYANWVKSIMTTDGISFEVLFGTKVGSVATNVLRPDVPTNPPI